MDSDGNVARSESFTDLADVLAGGSLSIRDSRPLNRSSLGGFVRSASESVDLAHLASSGGKPFGIGQYLTVFSVSILYAFHVSRPTFLKALTLYFFCTNRRGRNKLQYFNTTCSPYVLSLFLKLKSSLLLYFL